MNPQPKPVKQAKTRKPLTRRTWMKKKPPRRLKRAGANREFIQWIHTRECYVHVNHAAVNHLLSGHCVCDGRLHAHHAKHLSQGGTDKHAVPLCARHHRQWHDANGVFRGLTKLERFAWAVKAIASTQLDYQIETGRTL